MDEISEDTLQALDKGGATSWTQTSQLISYSVPGNESTALEFSMALNWGRYSITTDVNGVRHAFSLPAGGMRPHLVEKVKVSAQEDACPQFAELISKTKNPFLQVITDSLATENVFCGGKAVLVGDAAAG